MRIHDPSATELHVGGDPNQISDQGHFMISHHRGPFVHPRDDSLRCCLVSRDARWSVSKS